MRKKIIKAAGLSDAGIKKKVNQDCYVYKIVDDGSYVSGIFAVADGVGGLAKGEVASSVAISNINKWWENVFKPHYDEREYVIFTLIQCFQTINHELITMAAGQEKIATTLSVVFIYKNEVIIVHIGDSRVYCISEGVFAAKITQLTQDHTCVVEKESGNRIIQKTVLTQCLGNKKDYQHYSYVMPLRVKDMFIVCSDGIYKTMSEETILSVIRNCKDNVEEICAALVDKAKNNGETDNISVIAINIQEDK